MLLHKQSDPKCRACIVVLFIHCRLQKHHGGLAKSSFESAKPDQNFYRVKHRFAHPSPCILPRDYSEHKSSTNYSVCKNKTAHSTVDKTVQL